MLFRSSDVVQFAHAGIPVLVDDSPYFMHHKFALFDDDPNKINDLEAEFRKVTPDLVQKTAREYLRPTNRTVLVIEPKAEQKAEPKAESKGGL